MSEILDIRMDDIKEVMHTPAHKAQHKKRNVNPHNHYLVDDYGVTVLITDEEKEAAVVYTEITESRQKAIIHVVNGFQHLVETNAPLMYSRLA